MPAGQRRRSTNARDARRAERARYLGLFFSPPLAGEMPKGQRGRFSHGNGPVIRAVAVSGALRQRSFLFGQALWRAHIGPATVMQRTAQRALDRKRSCRERV